MIKGYDSTSYSYYSLLASFINSLYFFFDTHIIQHIPIKLSPTPNINEAISKFFSRGFLIPLNIYVNYKRLVPMKTYINVHGIYAIILIMNLQYVILVIPHMKLSGENGIIGDNRNKTNSIRPSLPIAKSKALIILNLSPRLSAQFFNTYRPI